MCFVCLFLIIVLIGFFVITLDIIDCWVDRLGVLGVWVGVFGLVMLVFNWVGGYSVGYFMLIWVWGFNCHCVIEVDLTGDLYFDCLV